MATSNTSQGAKTVSSEEEDLSMEEILQSIRKIIADDDGVAKKPAAPPEEVADDSVLELTEMVEEPSPLELKVEETSSQAPEAVSGDILSSIDEALTAEKPAEKPAEKAVEKPVEEPAPAAKAASPQDDIDALFASFPATPVEEAPVVAPAKPVVAEPAAPVVAPVVAPAVAPPAKPSPVETGDTLLSEEASSAAVSSIQKLKAAEPELPPLQLAPSPLFRSSNTVEDMVADMLRPMMKSWLDANLPQIVERIVEREVKKLTKYLTDPGD